MALEQRWPSYAVPPASGADFERLVGTIFEDLGYEVLLTSPSHGFGADLILVEPESGKQIVVETRLYSKGPLSNDAVQQVTSAVLAWGAAEGWVVTNAPSFSDNAVHLAMMNGIRLIAGSELDELMVQAEGVQANKRIAAVSAPFAAMGPAPAQMPYGAAASAPFGPAAAPGEPYGAYSMPGADASAYPAYPYPPQLPGGKKKHHLGWLTSILIALAVIVVLLAIYIILAPPLFDAIEANNPRLHIMRWDELVELIRPS